MANVISEIEVLEKYLPAVLALLSGSASETITTPAETIAINAGSFGKITVAIPAVPVVISKTA